MASMNDEFWTIQSNNLLVDQRISKDSVFRTSNSDQNGWLEILAQLRNAGAPKSLNRVHVRRQWTKICEEYKKITELSNGNLINIEELNVPYYTKLKIFFEKQFAQTEQQKANAINEDENKLLSATLLKANSFRQCYADRWSVTRTNLLIDARIAKDEIFKGRGHTTTAWHIVLADMVLLGESDTITIPQIKKKWDNLITRYQDLIKAKSSKIHNWPYFEKLHEFFTTKNFKNSSIDDFDSESNDLDIVKLSPDKWTQDNTNLLIEARIAKNDYFKGEDEDSGWQNVLGDMIKLGKTEALTIENIKNKWENLKKNYDNLVQSSTIGNKTDWPYFQKLHDFFKSSSNHQILNEEVIKDEKCTQFKWTDQFTDLLIKIRIEKNDCFAKWNEVAWTNVLRTLRESIDTKSLTVLQISKKWNNLYSKYSIIKKSKKKSNWIHFETLNSFFSSNKTKHSEKLDSKYEDLENQTSLMKNKCYADRWPTKRIKLLIEKRIARDPIFDGRKLSSVGWKTILQDMRAAGTPSNITVLQIKKKWENLCRKYKLMKNNNNLKKSWTLFKSMDEYFKMKDVKLEEPDYCDIPQKQTISMRRNIVEEKNTKCRLCQQDKIEYLLENDKELCGKISECLSINVFENMEFLPPGVCKKCRISIDEFYPFLIHCRNVDKELHDTINLTPEADIKIEPFCMIDDESIYEKDDSNKIDDSSMMKNETVTTSFECSECPVVFNSPGALQTHLKSHCNSSRYFCDMCDSSFSRQSVLYSHIKTHFVMENMLVVIPETQESTINDHSDSNDCFNNLELIENTKTVIPETSSCIVCKKTFKTRRALREHLQTHSRTILKCPREGCNKSYASFKSLENHEMKHLGLKSFLCVVCGKGFVTKNALQTHEKIHLEVKEFECTTCSIRFAVASNLRAHQKKHHEGVRFYCSQCPKAFLSKDSLKRHEIAHAGIKDFICDICSAAFYTAKELRKHKFYHDGKRMHHCNLCFKTFYEKHHLTVHLRSHTDERPYPCKISGCGKAFRESQKLRRHMKQQHRYQN